MVKTIFSRVIVVLMICIIIFANISTAYGAQYFTDVKNDHWAKNFIDRLTELGIVKGFADATFRPNDPVSKTAAISMIYQMLGKAGKLENIEGLVDKHQKTLEKTGIHTYAAWAKPAIAYALEKNIVHEDELKTFFKDGKNAEARRIDVAIFLGKALSGNNLLNSSITILPFTDADFISSTAAKYVSYLIDRGIINKNGDHMGRFNPNHSISRAEICTMIALGYSQISDGKTVAINPGPKLDSVAVVPKDEAREGNISYLDSITKTMLVKFVDGNTQLFHISNGVEINLNGIAGTYNDLQTNQEVVVHLNEGKTLTKIEVKNFVPNMEAVLNAVVPNTGFTLLVVRENTTNTMKSLKAFGSTKVELNGLPSSLDKLKSGDILKLKVDGQNVLGIVATSKTKYYQGTIEEVIHSFDTKALKIKVNDELKVFSIDPSVKVIKNSVSKNLSDLKKGDIATITTEYDTIVDIKANSVFSKVNGKIKSITIAKPNSLITILTGAEEKMYPIDNGIRVTINNSSKALYDLRIDQLVELELENDNVIVIAARDDLTQKQLSGVVTDINTSSKIIKIQYYDATELKIITKTIMYKTETKVMSTKFQIAIGIANLKVNDQVIIIGEEVEGNFTADRIMIVD